MQIHDSNTSKRAEWLKTTIFLLRQDLEEDRFADAIGHFRQAIALSRGLKDLRALTNETAQDEAFKLLPQNWRIAEAMLDEARAAEPSFRIDSDLQKKLRAAREDEILANAIYRTDRTALEGKTETARAQLNDLLTAHPDDSRIKDRLHALDHPQPLAEKLAASPPAPIAATPENPVATAVATSPSEADPAASEGTPPNEPEDRAQPPRRTKFLIAHSTWTAVKNFSVLAAATSMLGLAALLLWQHFSTSVPSKHAIQARSLAPVLPNLAPTPASPAASAAKNGAAPDDEAWDLVKTSNDPALLREFLSAYPKSAHAVRVKVKLSAMDWAKIDKSNVDQVKAYLKLHPRSPYRADAEKLLAATAQPSDRDAILHAVRTYREAKPDTFPPSSDGVLDEPSIAGDRATLRYHTTGSAGPLVYSFALTKQDGAWSVETVR